MEAFPLNVLKLVQQERENRNVLPMPGEGHKNRLEEDQHKQVETTQNIKGSKAFFGNRSLNFHNYFKLFDG
ncbi:hypothetical protein SDC9_169631 [bioreactor metagenome]|uniref:Uncharacterized protein n=1 Tax=bioreactor metagenome TaxID=1076179 RepID=A0A645G5U4_9ZZZZ